MPKCPECGEAINCLNYLETGQSKYVFDSKNYEESGFEADGQTTDYECPECGKILFTDEKEARRFLEKKEAKKYEC